MIGYMVSMVMCHLFETFRVLLFPNVVGYLILGGYKLLGYFWELDADYNTVIITIYAAGVCISIFLWNYCGEVDFKPCGDPSGPHGVGCKRFWTKENQNHILVYYPISRKQWQKGVED